jgi:2-keto-3-deoxy-L-rhamnonate aldolase RhmA
MALNALHRLRRGEAVFGVIQTFPEATVTEIAVWCGYDFVIVDCEHGVVDETAQMAVFRAIAGTSAFSLVRVRAQDESAVARYLDFGADGVLVPDVRRPDQARKIGFAATRRWTGGLRGDRYGLQREDQAERRPLVLVLIESPEGVRNVEEIIAVEGIDGAIVGAGDLSTNLGAPGDFGAPAFVAAVEKVEKAVRGRSKILGSKPDKALPIAALFDRGHRLFIIGRDMVLTKSIFADTLAVAKKQLPSIGP